MEPGKSTITRAMEIAESGSCRTVEHIRRQLRDEGYPHIDDHLAGASIRKQLLDRIKAAK